MREHNLKNAPGITVSYTIQSSQKIKIEDCHIRGNRVDDDKFKKLLAVNNDWWVEEISESLMKNYTEETCVACNGSGEGSWDGSTCYNCGGRGTEFIEEEEE